MSLTIEKFEARRKINWANGCHEWTGWKRAGYGRFRQSSGRDVSVHRWIYEYTYGEIPGDTNLHHVCENKGCVNPQHLQEMSHEDHLSHHKGGETHCKRGHEFTDENTYINKTSGNRQCKACVKINRKIWEEKNKKHLSQYRKQWYKENEDQQKEYHVQYYKENSEKIKARVKEYKRKKRSGHGQEN